MTHEGDKTETKGRTAILFYLFSFSNRCSACQLGTDSLIYWSGCVSGICKCIFLLICSSHCHMPPTPNTPSSPSASTIHIHIYSKSMHLSSDFFLSVCSLFISFRFFFHTHKSLIKTLTLSHGSMIGNRKRNYR